MLEQLTGFIHNIHIRKETPFLLLVLILVSGFASSSETAFFSLNRFQLRRIRERFRPSFERIKKLLSRPSRLLILILVINECTNLTISSLITNALTGESSVEDQNWLFTAFLSMAISMPLLMILGEITPKIIASKMNRVVAIVNSQILIVFYYIGFPVLWIFDQVVDFVLQKIRAEGKDPLSKSMSVLSEEDFLVLMDEGHREGTIYAEEKRLIKKVLEFDDSTVADVMTPISQIFSVSADSKILEVLPELRAQKYSRVPVYSKSKKNLVGILYVKDLLILHKHPDLQNADVKSVMVSAVYVSPPMRLSALFRKLKVTKTHMAFVRDSAEQTIGVVTMEDVLESIFGEIEDERDIRK